MELTGTVEKGSFSKTQARFVAGSTVFTVLVQQWLERFVTFSASKNVPLLAAQTASVHLFSRPVFAVS